MDTLKKLFPLSFKFSKDVANLIVGIIVNLVLGLLVGVLIKLATLLTGWLPVIGKLIAWALGVVSSLIGIYVLAGIIILVLVFTKVIKE